MTRIHLVGLSSGSKKRGPAGDGSQAPAEEDEIYYGQLSDDIDHEQIQAAPFMQGQGQEKPKLQLRKT